MLSRIIRGSIHRPVAVVMIALLVIVLGIVSLSLMPVDFYPSIPVPKITVVTSYQGLPAKEIRELLTIPVEDTLASLQGLRHISSSSIDGISLIELQFSWGTDMKQAGIQTREMADIASLQLPEGAAKPMVLPVNPLERPLITVGVFPKEKMDITVLKRLCEREIRTLLQQAEGVGSIQVLGGLDEEIRVEPQPSKISVFGITIQSLAQMIQSTNIEIPAGSIEQGSMEYIIKTDATSKSVSDIENIYLNSQGQEGPGIRLGDIASVELTTDDRRSFVTQNSQEGIALLVRKQGGYSPVSLSDNIMEKLHAVELAYGKTLEIRVLHNDSDMINASIHNLIFSGLIGIVVAFFVLLFFLKDFSASVILILSIPLSLLATLALFPLIKVGINIMSIGGLAIGIGMLVDNSVVVLENIQRKADPSSREMVINATTEIAASTVGSTFTSLIVFLPLFFLPGIIGVVFKDLAWGVSLSLLSSFIVSITVIPVLYVFFGSKHRTAVKSGKVYRRILRFLLRKPWILVGISSILILQGIYCFFMLDRDWLSAPESHEYTVQISFPSGTNIEYLFNTSRSFSSILDSLPAISSYHFSAGGELDDPYYLAGKSPESEVLNCQVTMRDNTDFPEENLKKLFLARFSQGSITDINVTPSALSFNEVLGIHNTETVTMQAAGQDYQSAYSYARRLTDSLTATPVKIYPTATKPKITVTPDRNAIKRMGVSVESVAQILGGSVFGVYAGSIEGPGGRIPIRIRYPKAFRSSIQSVKEIFLPAGNGAIFPIAETVFIKEEKSPPVFYRNDRQDIVKIELPATEKESLAILKNSTTNLEAEEWDNQVRIIILLFFLSVFLMYIILGIQFDSFLLPLLMLIIIPFGFIGVFSALFVTNTPLSLNGILGSLVVIGIIVNNGIIFYDHYSQRIKSSALITTGIYRGAGDRIRAVFISFYTTMFALLPVALNISGKNPQSTMAISIIGGILFANFISIFVFPVMYKVFFTIRYRNVPDAD
jgi:hydrophobic/amphiphilic exporter-1 (mainly G- bacteria), HAE1 family